MYRWVLAVLLALTAGAAPLGPGSYLHTDGRALKSRDGQVVALRGVNVGGWLVTEGWMCGQTDSGERWALEQLEARFGAERAGLLIEAWRDNWFTTRDLDKIAEWGFNLIRVPFGYRNLQDAAGNWRRNARGEIDFARLDWVVKEAARRGIYVILDLHIWPGERESYSLISRHVDGSNEARARSAAIWREVARHFRGVGAIAGFDLINEPEGSPGDAVQRAFTDAIRAEDPERIVIGESMGYTNFRDPYWRNSIWSAHYPEDKEPGTLDEKLTRWAKKAGITDDVAVPVFIGEMKAPEDTKESAAGLAEAMNKRGWHWAVWCHKAVNQGGWAAFNYNQSLRYDLGRDNFDVLLAKWSTDLVAWHDPAKPANSWWTGWWVDGFRQAPPR